MKEPKAPPRAALTILFAAIVFCILSITMVIVSIVIYLLVQTGVLGEVSPPNILLPIVVFALVSILTGTIVATLMSSVPLKPANTLISGMNRLAGGDYETRIDMGHNRIGQELSESFNLLAGELQNTEMLRSDFVNNFSHEFKTPIVSIRGFAKLLQKANLSDEQQEYLKIVVEESGRLADMATNILNLTKVENQSILTDITFFNLSEQIRNCVLLFEKKWSRKELKIFADFNEHYISANEELLKQIWINIIDNAVKFSPKCGEICISIKQASDMITVSIKNSGDEISDEDKERIFRKYYQGDKSHSSEGTGIGLAIVKRITELHGGTVTVIRSSGKTVFSVVLPTE